MEYKIALGYLAILIGLTGYSFYIKSIFKGHTKPHSFSWLLWALITGIVFSAQITKGGGAGAWVTGVSSIVCLFIGCAGLGKNRRPFSKFDWMFLGVALGALGLWYVTKDPTISIVLVATVDSLGYASTLRKGYLHPAEENITSFGLNSLKYIASVAALQSYSLATWLYPAAMIVMNGATAILVAVRRRQKLA
jgi:hypothetical protein